jgi:hypothetical protein
MTNVTRTILGIPLRSGGFRKYRRWMNVSLGLAASVAALGITLTPAVADDDLQPHHVAKGHVRTIRTDYTAASKIRVVVRRDGFRYTRQHVYLQRHAGDGSWRLIDQTWTGRKGWGEFRVSRRVVDVEYRVIFEGDDRTTADKSGLIVVSSFGPR